MKDNLPLTLTVEDIDVCDLRSYEEDKEDKEEEKDEEDEEGGQEEEG